jgi:bacillithiol biosynthesis cysteine-adding enzyme BshC
LSVRVLSTPITGSSLARIAIEGGSSSWYVRRPTSAAEWTERANVVRQSLLSHEWLTALAPAFDASGLAAEKLDRAAKSGFAVTTGQQPGLFGGPLYTWWKALSVRSLAARLEKLTGAPVVPIFWAATDDSDFAEASYTVVATSTGAERIEMTTSAPTGTPVAEIPLGDLRDQMARLEDAAGSAANGAALDAVRAAYTAERTVGSAYVAMLRTILEPLGVAVLDASDASVRHAAFPLLRSALENAEQIEGALNFRSRELKSAGHSAQVKLVKGRTLVFSGAHGVRDRVRSRDVDEVLESAEPGSFGPNVLLRPIVERSIIPTVAYLGGGAEIAYFAQTTAVADVLEVPAPLILPRWSGFVIEPKIERILERYSLTVEDFRDPHAVESQLARASLPEGVRQGIKAVQDSVTTSAERLASAEGADLVPPSVIDGLRRTIDRRVDRLERRFAASVKQKGNDALRDAAVARGALFPLGVAQERALNVVPLLARQGDDLVRAVSVETDKHAERFT